MRVGASAKHFEFPDELMIPQRLLKETLHSTNYNRLCRQRFSKNPDFPLVFTNLPADVADAASLGDRRSSSLVGQLLRPARVVEDTVPGTSLSSCSVTPRGLRVERGTG